MTMNDIVKSVGCRHCTWRHGHSKWFRGECTAWLWCRKNETVTDEKTCEKCREREETV